MTTPTFAPPIVRQAIEDAALSPVESRAIARLWQGQHLSASEYKPLKAETLAFLLHVKRQSAARILLRLVAEGYLLMIVPENRSDARLFLLVNVKLSRAA